MRVRHGAKTLYPRQVDGFWSQVRQSHVFPLRPPKILVRSHSPGWMSPFSLCPACGYKGPSTAQCGEMDDIHFHSAPVAAMNVFRLISQPIPWCCSSCRLTASGAALRGSLLPVPAWTSRSFRERSGRARRATFRSARPCTRLCPMAGWRRRDESTV